MLSRRKMLAAPALGAAMTVSPAKAASFGNPDEPPQSAINGKGPGNLADPGPQNPVLGRQFPSAQSAPATDVGGRLAWQSRIEANTGQPKIRKPSGTYLHKQTHFADSNVRDFKLATSYRTIRLRLSGSPRK
jgi:hypothetical protein